MFETFLENLGSLPSIILLTETWNTIETYNLCKLERYSGHHTFRPASTRGGGVSLFCLENFNCQKVPAGCICNTDVETCAIKVRLGRLMVGILGIYRPPTGSTTRCIETIECMIHDNILNADLIILAGDLNLNLQRNDLEEVKKDTVT